MIRLIGYNARNDEIHENLDGRLAGALFSAKESAWRVFGAGHLEQPAIICRI
jgi:hypothetical protein